MENKELRNMLPFLDESQIKEIANAIINNSEKYKEKLSLTDLAPFLDETDCDEIFTKSIDENGEYLTGLLPFVSEKCLDDLVDKYISGEMKLNVSQMYPFMKSITIKKLFDFELSK